MRPGPRRRDDDRIGLPDPFVSGVRIMALHHEDRLALAQSPRDAEHPLAALGEHGGQVEHGRALAFLWTGTAYK